MVREERKKGRFVSTEDLGDELEDLFRPLAGEQAAATARLYRAVGLPTGGDDREISFRHTVTESMRVMPQSLASLLPSDATPSLIAPVCVLWFVVRSFRGSLRDGQFSMPGAGPRLLDLAAFGPLDASEWRDLLQCVRRAESLVRAPDVDRDVCRALDVCLVGSGGQATKFLDLLLSLGVDVPGLFLSRQRLLAEAPSHDDDPQLPRF